MTARMHKIVRGAWMALLGSASVLLAPTVAGEEAAPETVAVATPKDSAIISGGVEGNAVTLFPNRSAVLSTNRPYKRVSIAQPEVADVNPVGPTNLLVTAKKAGATQLIVWDEQERSQLLDVNVRLDIQMLQEQLKAMFPNSKIEVHNAAGVIILKGRVSSTLAAEQAAQVASPYGTKVLNLLEVAGGQQVMLQVKFAEVSKTATSALGVNLFAADGSFIGGSNIGQINPFNQIPAGSVGNTPAPQGVTFADPRAISPSVTLFGAGQIGSFYIEAMVQALRQNNLLRVLAEPNLVAISGQEAEFLAGGSFPIPVPGGGSQGGSTAVTIEFREYGVKLKFVPIVTGDGRIRLKVSPEVSDLDFTTAVRFDGFTIPGLTERKLTTTVEMVEGQTFALAGLLNNNVTASKEVTPLLGDLPVVGTLFRSVRYQRKETELVVLVTPRIVEAMNPGQVPPVPGEKWRHPTENDLFFKADIGGPLAGPRPTTRPTENRGDPPKFYGQYGFTPVQAVSTGGAER